jgi:predicted deacylase
MPVSKHRIRLPTMTPGTTRSVAWLRFGHAGARPKVYMQAAIHANELPGTMALHHLMPMLTKADQAGRIRGEVVLVPTVNPIGLSQVAGNVHLGRYDLLSRDNFNRNWLDLSGAVAERVGLRLGRNAAANVDLIRAAALAALRAMDPVTELQTLRAEMMKLSIDSDVVLDLHCDMNAALHLFTAAPDLKGAAQELAAELGVQATLYNEPFAEALTFSGVNGALWPRLAARFPGAAIPQACFSSTLELRGQHDVSDALGASDAANLYRYLVRRGVIAGRSAALPRLKSAPTPISGMDVGYCRVAGFMVYRLPPGAKVKKGDVVCEVLDPANPGGSLARTPMRSRTDGILFSRRRDGALAWPGMVAYRIAGAKPLAHRKGMSGLDD